MGEKIKSIAMAGSKEDVLSGIQELKDKYGPDITIEELIKKLEKGR